MEVLPTVSSVYRDLFETEVTFAVGFPFLSGTVDFSYGELEIDSAFIDYLCIVFDDYFS